MRHSSVSSTVSSTFATLLVLVALAQPALGQGNAKNGQYLANASGCINCHTAAQPGASPFAGGRALKTPFGTFYGPNITPHRSAGLGNWAEADFVRAMRLGQRPDGSHYYPAFPYSSYTKMSEGDLRDLWAFLRMVPPDAQPSRPHELRFPFSWRPLLVIWKWFFFTPGSAAPASDFKLTAQQARGAYLATALGHCGECHTPRNFLGAPRTSLSLSGGEIDEGLAPNLTPTNLKSWNDEQLRNFLKTGLTASGDPTGDAMQEVVDNMTSKLTAEDVAALIAYLRSLPALPDGNKKK